LEEWRKTGYLDEKYLEKIWPEEKELEEKPLPIIECPEEIPCTPCRDYCPTGAIEMEGLNGIPKLNPEKCTGCLTCVQVCPGLAIFIVHYHKPGMARIYLPYEFCPLPKVGQKVKVLNRKGEEIGEGTVFFVLPREKSKGDTPIVGIEVKRELARNARHIRW